jgi:hypothetical protein
VRVLGGRHVGDRQQVRTDSSKRDVVIRAIGGANDPGNTDAGPGGFGDQIVSGRIGSDTGDQVGGDTEAGQIRRNVPSGSARAHEDGAWIGHPRPQGPARTSHDVEVAAAEYDN